MEGGIDGSVIAPVLREPHGMKYFWKIYSGFCLVSVLSAVAYVAVLPGVKFWWSGISLGVDAFFVLVSAFLLLLPLVGLLAFAWEKRIGSVWMWKTIVWIGVFLTVLQAVVQVADSVFCVESCDVWRLLLAVPTFVLRGVFLAGIYLYAWRSHHIWESGKATPVLENDR